MFYIKFIGASRHEIWLLELEKMKKDRPIFVEKGLLHPF